MQASGLVVTTAPRFSRTSKYFIAKVEQHDADM